MGGIVAYDPSAVLNEISAFSRKLAITKAAPTVGNDAARVIDEASSVTHCQSLVRALHWVLAKLEVFT